MRTHTNNFKNEIKEFGRMTDSKITYNGSILESEDLYGVNCYSNASLLKSLMKELKFESKIQIPINTIVNYQFGVYVNGEYEYINYGDYIVYENKYNLDTETYEHICYDKMLYSMKEYKQLQSGAFPMTVRQFINNLCSDLSLTFANSNDVFANYDKVIQNDLYKDLGYTYRDIFDELSAVTGSIICLNENNEVEVRYSNDTGEIITKEFLKDTNVSVQEHYGPINSIVLSRSAESDNIFIQDEESISQNGLCEIKIIDNQIMNFDDRSDYLDGLLEKLNGLNYYVTDFDTTGVSFFEIFDRFNVQVDDNLYNCILFNSEFENKMGISEKIYSEKLEETQTDYSKSDKTDRRITNVSLIVDKQEKTITGLVEQTDNNEKMITETRQDVNGISTKIGKINVDKDGTIAEQTVRLSAKIDEIRGEIGDITDITTSQETIYSRLEFESINASEPITINIHPIEEDISYLVMKSELSINENFKLPNRVLQFKNTSTQEIFSYELPIDLFFVDDIYDELNMNYSSDFAKIVVKATKRIGLDSSGNKYVLDEPQQINLPETNINLTTGNYEIRLLNYENGYLYVRLMSQNMYTSQFATIVQLNTSISQTKDSISTSVDRKIELVNGEIEEANSKIIQHSDEISSKVSKNGVISSINQSPEEIIINANKVNLNGYLTVTNANNTYASKNGLSDGTTTINGGCITTGTISTNRLSSDVITTSNFTAQNINANKITTGTLNGNNVNITNINASNITSGTLSADKINGGELNLTGKNVAIKSENFNVDKNGNVKIYDIGQSGNTSLKVISNEGQSYQLENMIRSDGIFLSQGTNSLPEHLLYLTTNASGRPSIQLATYKNNQNKNNLVSDFGMIVSNETNTTSIFADGITTPSVTQTSLATAKQDFEKLENALEIINKVDIYKYHLKGQKKKDKKHIGFVIGDEFNYSKEITSEKNDGVDLYSMISVCFKAIKEQQKIIETMQQEIQNLKEKLL